jgi:hypothetical protein
VHRLIFAFGCLGQKLSVRPAAICAAEGQYQTLISMGICVKAHIHQLWPQRRNALRVFHAGTGVSVAQVLEAWKIERWWR